MRIKRYLCSKLSEGGYQPTSWNKYPSIEKESLYGAPIQPSLGFYLDRPPRYHLQLWISFLSLQPIVLWAHFLVSSAAKGECGGRSAVMGWSQRKMELLQENCINTTWRFSVCGWYFTILSCTLYVLNLYRRCFLTIYVAWYNSKLNKLQTIYIEKQTRILKSKKVCMHG